MEDQVARLVYMGRRKDNKGKTRVAFAWEGKLTEQLSREAGFQEAYPSEVTNVIENCGSIYDLKFTGRIGAVYECTCKIDAEGLVKTMRAATLKYIEPCTFPKLATVWETLDRAIHLGDARAKAEKACDADPAMSSALAVIKARYKALPAMNRRGFQLWLLEQLDTRR